jgi:pimeloyl-ACP methyl ester carboxylesterase
MAQTRFIRFFPLGTSFALLVLLVVACGDEATLTPSPSLTPTLSLTSTPEPISPETTPTTVEPIGYSAMTSVPMDEFYESPTNVPAEPGVLLRSEPLTDRELPKGTKAWRILYTSTFHDGSPALSIGTVLAPANPPPGPRPVLTWAHGTIGNDQRCQYSLLKKPFADIPAIDQVIENGWVIIQTDYAWVDLKGAQGYMVGEAECRNALDAMRAVKQLEGLSISNDTIVWGWSQGGGAALWTGIVAPRYAPEITLRGVVTFSPSSSLTGLLKSHMGSPGIAVSFASIIDAYTTFYPDVDLETTVPNPKAREFVQKSARLCETDAKDMAIKKQLLADLGGIPVVEDLNAGAFGKRLRENDANHPIKAPLLVIQALDDTSVPPVVNDTYVKERCAAGQPLEYWRTPDRTHWSYDAVDSRVNPPIIRWTQDRFAVLPQKPDCN